MKNLSFPDTDPDFGKVYSLYFFKLVRFSETYLSSREEAENLVQDLFVSLWERRNDISFSGNLNAFLFIIAKNRCIDVLRRQKAEMAKKSSLSDLSEKEIEFKLYSLQKFDENNFNEQYIENMINRAIDSLPPRCREIFLLNRMEGMKYKDIASHLNVSVNTVEGQMSIALTKLRLSLKEYLPLLVFLLR